MRIRTKRMHTRSCLRLLLRSIANGHRIIAKQNEHNKVEFFGKYQRLMSIKWMRRGHAILYKNSLLQRLLILYFFRKDVAIPAEYLDLKPLGLSVLGPRRKKEFFL